MKPKPSQIDFRKITIADHLINAETRAMDEIGVNTLHDLSTLLQARGPDSVVALKGMTRRLVATCVLFANAYHAPYMPAYDLWFDNYRINDVNGKIWFKKNKKRFSYAEEELQALKTAPAVNNRAADATAKVESPEPDPSPRFQDAKPINTLKVVDEETMAAEEFMVAYYETKAPYDPVKAAIDAQMFTEQWAIEHPRDASKKANERLTKSRAILERQGELVAVQTRVGLDRDVAKDTMLSVAIDGLLATERVWKRGPEGKYVELEVPDWHSRGLMMKNFRDIFKISLTEDDIKGLARMPASSQDAEKDLVDLIVRNCKHLNIDIDRLFFRVRDRLLGAAL